jgi:hypothetical protein
MRCRHTATARWPGDRQQAIDADVAALQLRDAIGSSSAAA